MCPPASAQPAPDQPQSQPKHEPSNLPADVLQPPPSHSLAGVDGHELHGPRAGLADRRRQGRRVAVAGQHAIDTQEMSGAQSSPKVLLQRQQGGWGESREDRARRRGGSEAGSAGEGSWERQQRAAAGSAEWWAAVLRISTQAASLQQVPAGCPPDSQGPSPHPGTATPAGARPRQRRRLGRQAVRPWAQTPGQSSPALCPAAAVNE